LVGGSLANVTVNDTLAENSAGGAFLAGGDSANYVPTAASLISQRRAYTRTNTNALTAFVFSRTRVAFSGAGDVTLRFGLPQLELGAFATSVVQTSAGAVTRNADNVSMTGTNFSDWYGAGEGAFVVDFGAVNCTEASPGALLSVCDNPLASNWFLTFITPTAVVNRARNSGADQADMVRFGVFTGGSKSALAYKVDSFASAVGGNAALTDTSGLVPASIAQMKIGAFDPFLTYANGCIRKINYYAPRVTNAETQAFSK
jgi:hypothetical protein